MSRKLPQCGPCSHSACRRSLRRKIDPTGERRAPRNRNRIARSTKPHGDYPLRKSVSRRAFSIRDARPPKIRYLTLQKSAPATWVLSESCSNSRLVRLCSMARDPQFEVPTQMREFAERNIEQVRAAYAQYMDAARKAQDMMASMVPANPLTAGMKQVQERTMKFTQQNIDASFSLASELTRATDLKDALEIQSRHAHLQIQAYSLQAQEFGRLLAGVAQNAPAELPAAGQLHNDKG